jgi:hypothetical protein
MLGAYSPFTSAEKAYHSANNVNELTSAAFEPGN